MLALFLMENIHPEAFGDYIVGTNHISANFRIKLNFHQELGVLDFMKRISLVEINHKGYKKNEENVLKMADVENLEGHKLSVKIRQIRKK